MRTIEEVVSELSSELIRFLNEPIDQNRRVKANLDHLKLGRCLKEIVEIHKAEKDGVLDKIKAEIEEKYGHCDICEYFEDYDYEDNNISEYRYVANVKDILQIIDKYKGAEE